MCVAYELDASVLPLGTFVAGARAAMSVRQARVDDAWRTDLDVLARCVCRYEKFAGWSEDISHCKKRSGERACV
jgi:hypothetical protein